jgi:hypothetical protein
MELRLIQMLQISVVSSIAGAFLANVSFLAFVVIVGISFYAAYYALNLSRLLVDKVQKSRAIWTAALSLLLSTFILAFILSPESGPYSGIFVVPAIALVLILAGWMDSTIGVAIDQDYFHRNTLHWKTIRPLFWVGIFIVFLVAPIATIMGLKLGLNDSQLFLSPFIAIPPFVYGTAALFVSGERSKDRKMKSYLRWLGLSVISLFAAFGISILSNNLGSAISVLFLALLAYFLYCAAKSLSPTNRIEKGSEGMKLKPV